MMVVEADEMVVGTRTVAMVPDHSFSAHAARAGAGWQHRFATVLPQA